MACPTKPCWDPLLCVGLAGFTWLLGLVGLDATHVPGLLGHQDLSQTHQTVLELSHHLERRRMFAAVCRQRYIVIIIVIFNAFLQFLVSSCCVVRSQGNSV